MKTKVCMIVFMSLLFIAQAQVAVSADSWTGKDKFYHVGGSALVSSMTYYVLKDKNVENAKTKAFLITLAGGILKEAIIDPKVSGKDLMADAVGSAVIFIPVIRF